MYLQSAGNLGTDNMGDMGFPMMPPTDYDSVNYDVSRYNNGGIQVPPSDFSSFQSGSRSIQQRPKGQGMAQLNQSQIMKLQSTASNQVKKIRSINQIPQDAGFDEKEIINLQELSLANQQRSNLFPQQ